MSSLSRRGAVTRMLKGLAGIASAWIVGQAEASASVADRGCSRTILGNKCRCRGFSEGYQGNPDLCRSCTHPEDEHYG